jgi:phosphoribosylamine--glycine ligase
MLTEKGPKVIEYNCRFGDPEAQVVLPLLETDLLTIMRAVRDGTLDKVDVRFSSKSACCVIMASGGYPQEYEKGKEITFSDVKDAIIYHAGTKLENGKMLTNGGRVLGITATADSLPEAIKKAYEAVEGVSFEGAHYRRDIGARALQILNQK